MNITNNKLYWKARKILLMLLLKIKSYVYKLFDNLEEKIAYESINKEIIKQALKSFVKSIASLMIVYYIEDKIYKENLIIFDNDLFVPIVIGGIGVAGVILGLYYANISSIYSSRYSNAPIIIAKAFQNDRLSRKCIFGIVDYIIFGFVSILLSIIKRSSCLLVLFFVIRSIYIVISYSLVGNRAYQLSDIYNVADDSYRVLNRIISKYLINDFLVGDNNFQNYFLVIAEKQIQLLKAIQRFESRKGPKENNKNSTTVEFMKKNALLIEVYWMNKSSISLNSFWFKNEARYQKWHLTSDTESSLALRTGTTLSCKMKHNYSWFENEMFTINMNCLENLINENDFQSVYLYLLAIKEMASVAIENNEVNSYLKHIEEIRQIVKRIIPNLRKKLNNKVKIELSGVVDILSVTYLNIVLQCNAFYNDYDINRKISETLYALDSSNSIMYSKHIRGKKDLDFYKRIITEILVENKRITPNWVIKQQIAKEEYYYLNSLLDIVRESINCVFGMGEILLENKCYFEACTILSRFYEYESKLSRFISLAEIRKSELIKFRVDIKLIWDDCKLEQLKDAINKWNTKIPDLFFESSSNFAIENWKNKDDYPDFLGECYNHICEEAIESIVNNDLKQFENNYNNLSKIMFLYQEYIRSDFVEKQDMYRLECAYYIFTSPIVEWAQIGGLAILWGEFQSDDSWNNYVKSCCELIFKKNDQSIVIAEKFIEYAKDRNQLLFGVGSRDILEERWKQVIADAIIEKCQNDTNNYYFDRQLKTESKLLKAFCPNFVDMRFVGDPSEVFWILCVNPYVSDDKKYHSHFLWEKKI